MGEKETGIPTSESRRRDSQEEEAVDLGRYVAILRANWVKIACLSFAVGIVTLLLMFLKPDMYRSSATISPVPEEGRRPPNMGMLVSLGIPMGETANVLELEALFQSNDLAARVFQKHDFWPILLPGSYDKGTGKFKAAKGLFSGLSGEKAEPKAPGEWNAIHAARGGLTVSLNRKTGTITVSFESRSPEGSAEIVKSFLEEAKSRLQEEALERANKNKKFIEEQIARTVDALTRERLYALYGYETEREMLARNRNQFGFRIIDSPRIPDQKSGPRRSRAVLLLAFLAFIVVCAFYLIRGSLGKQGDRRAVQAVEEGKG